MKFRYFLFFLFLFLIICPTYALSNYETRYDIDYSSYNSTYSEQIIDRNNVKLSDFVDNLKNNTNLTRNYLIMPYYTSDGNIYQLYLFVFDNNSNYTFNFYGNNYRNFIFLMTSSDSKWGYDIRVDSNSLSNDIYSTTFYNNFITCASGGSCSTSSMFDTKFKVFKSSTSITNDSNNSLSFTTSGNDCYMLYYSSMPLHISNTYDIDNTKVLYKSIYIDNTSIDVGSDFPTYYDYTHPITPEPEPEPEPEPTPDLSNSLFKYVFWFTDNSSEYGVLANMYILLFLYCIGNMFIKFLTIIYHTKNLNNRR